MAHVGPELFAFFRELRDNNDRTWFQANRERYERDVREPLLRFIEALEEPLAAISPTILVLARKSGGSLYRINRDVRFSADKSPYKTWAALLFRHESSRDVHAPGFYLHLSPEQVFAGAGIWHPDRSSLTAIRERLVERPDEWRRAKGEVVDRGWELGGDSLTRAPRGFDPQHPLIEDIRRKDFIVGRNLAEADATRPGFSDRYAGMCAETAPFVRFLAGALDLEF